MRFVLRLKDGESMASLCRQFGISRVTGYKIYERYKECGLEGLTDRARTPYRYANKLPAQLETMIVAMRREKPTWGARKLRERLLRNLPNDVRVPACTPSWTAMGWLLGKGTLAQKPQVPLYPKDALRMLCGAPTTRASSCSGTKDTATPLPSRTTPAVIFSSVKPWSPSRNRVLLPPWSTCSRSAACPMPFAPTTACPLLHRMVSST
jgi:Homeodomain-like domain